ncbi:unnamed protein product [Strongylus vulgaris]|uniref:Uncharacterized protein n=1 Tax=Strongylus vulgaris TaxID=40348 RepID=A0A3P7JCR9_STRVU|nr:unnamed protein product [Strongylus vulgaris]
MDVPSELFIALLFYAKNYTSPAEIVALLFLIFGSFMVLELQMQHDGAASSLHGSYVFSGALQSASSAAKGPTGILIALAIVILVVGFVVVRKRRAASSARGPEKFDKKVFSVKESIDLRQSLRGIME